MAIKAISLELHVGGLLRNSLNYNALWLDKNVFRRYRADQASSLIFLKKSYIIENWNTQNLGARELTLNPYFSTYEKLKNTYKTEWLAFRSLWNICLKSWKSHWNMCQYQCDNHALLSVAEQIYVPGKFHQGGTLVKFPERKDQLLFAPRKDFSYFIDDLLGPRGNMASTEPVHYFCTSLHNLGLLKFGIKFAS